MPRCELDTSVRRLQVGSFAFPLGVYPIESLEPRPGYIMEFEASDGGEESSDWEEWPDRYVFEAVISAERAPALMRSLLLTLPPRVYPILDVIGHDAYRELDPFIAYELVGLDRVLEATRIYKPFLYEDGLCGFGAMCDDPFAYVFLDEHKIFTVRVPPESKERVERILRAFDLELVEDPAGADAAAHEHRGVLLAPEDRPDLLTNEEIIERLRDDWHLVLNVDAETNQDDDGNDLGVTAWRCLVRVTAQSEGEPRYAEVILWANSLRQAEESAFDAVESALEVPLERVQDCVVVSADRLAPEQLQAWRPALHLKSIPGKAGSVIRNRWLG